MSDVVLATVLFTDIVGSTERAVQLGDERWKGLLERHQRAVRVELSRYAGVEIDTAGDGFLASFGAPGQAVRCAVAVVERSASVGLPVRAGVHTGECERMGEKLTGVTVHAGARICAEAGPSEVMVSGMVRDLLAGSAFPFGDRGLHALKGIPGEWRLYSLQVGRSGPLLPAGGTPEIVGRDAELELIRAFGDGEGFGALVVEGEAGIGKTTLWREAVGTASRRGSQVLLARPGVAEAALAFAGLADLFGDILDEVIGELAPPQAAALEVALLRRQAEGGPADPRTVAAGVLGAVRAAAAACPVVVAVDDVQWLDSASAAALAYACRRLTEEPVQVVASLRLAPGMRSSQLVEALPAERLTRVEVGPLSAGALHRVIRGQLSRTLARPVLQRVHELSAGNPFYALELARSLPEDAAAGVSLPPSLERLTHERLSRLPTGVRRLLEPAALLADPTVEQLESLAGRPGRVGGQLDDAVAAGVIEIAGMSVRFTHPLLAEGMAAMIGPRRRRELHRQLADLVSDPEERARHLALASDGPSADVAAVLDEAAQRSRARGAPDAAAELAELARRLTPSDDVPDLRRRGLKASEYHFDAGDTTRATDVLREMIASSPPGRDRAELLYRLASMSWMNLIPGVREPALQALEEAGDDAELRSGIHDSLAWVAFYLGDLHGASEHARMCAEHAARAVGPATRADALATRGFVEFVRGNPAERAMSEAVELQDHVSGSWTEASVFTTPRSVLGLELMWSGRLDEARRLFEQDLAEFVQRGAYTAIQEVLCYVSEVESRAGRWRQAAQHAEQGMENLVASGRRRLSGQMFLFPQALAAAHLGHVEDARRWAAEGVELGLSNGDLFNTSANRAVLGFLDISLSEYEQALNDLEPVVAYLERMGAAEPAIIPCVPDYVEALVALGRADDAEPRVDRLEEQGRVLARPWALAVAARCRGLIALARRDLGGAEVALEAAVQQHCDVPQPFDLARTLLVLGEVQRRAKRRRAARETLQQALATFDELGAALWAERARREMARIGGRAPTSGGLTPSEQRIAVLVAGGKTNRQVAAALYLTERTVESSLTRIYAKLGLRSRTELAARMRDA
jgi:class 3 adenylate cyclase/DNA-binding CsgD family transcriptional regulator